MEDLIKREKLFEHIKAVCLEGDGGALITSEDVLKMAIKDIPSAEHLIYEEMEKADIEAKAYAKGFKEGLEARKQGEWERIPYSMSYGYRCSLCHQKTLEKHWNFCPNCGSKMRGEHDD